MWKTIMSSLENRKSCLHRTLLSTSCTRVPPYTLGVVECNHTVLFRGRVPTSRVAAWGRYLEESLVYCSTYCTFLCTYIVELRQGGSRVKPCECILNCNWNRLEYPLVCIYMNECLKFRANALQGNRIAAGVFSNASMPADVCNLLYFSRVGQYIIGCNVWLDQSHFVV